jgi:peptide/nickel transport system permease protein
VTGYLVRRLLWALVLVVVMTFFTFVIFFVIPTEETRAGRGSAAEFDIREQFQLQGMPLPAEYGQYLWAIVRHGDLGTSFISGEDVTTILWRTFPVTLSLLVGGLALCIAIALVIGVLSALHPRSLLDRGAMVFVLVGISAHPVWVGLILLYWVGWKWDLAPITGYCDFLNPPTACGGAVDWAYHLLLPWTTFAILFAALYTRMIRASVLESLEEDYVRTARAKGAGEWRVLRVHVLRNALLPVITMVGMDAGLAFGGAIFVETVYGLPGIGRLVFNALARRDLPVIMGVVLVVTTAIIAFNLIVDLLYGWLDPKVRIPARERVRAGGGAARAPAGSPAVSGA